MGNSLTAEELYSKAEQARERADYAAALSFYRQAAEKADVWAMIRIGQMYYGGEGVSKDDAEAKCWIAKAVDAGGSETMFDVGYMYLRSDGLPKDLKEALRWLRMGAELGNANAMLDLGTMYENGEGVDQDRDEAIRWYRQAAEQDNFGVHKLALICLSRLGASVRRRRDMELCDICNKELSDSEKMLVKTDLIRKATAKGYLPDIAKARGPSGRDMWKNAVEMGAATNWALCTECHKDVTEYANKSSCFVATAACGATDVWEVRKLSCFRDTILQQSQGGRNCIECYYQFSPALADSIAPSHILRVVVRNLIVRPLALIASLLLLLRRHWGRFEDTKTPNKPDAGDA